MQHENELQERSVLDEIRSTIASLDAIRGQEPATYESVSATSVVEVAPTRTDETNDESPGELSSVLVDEPTAVKVEQPSAVAVAADQPSTERSAVAVDEPPEQQSSFQDVVDIESDETDAETALALARDGYDSDGDDLGSSRHALVRCVSVNKNARIMIVDDEPLNIMTFRQHLKLEGYQRFVSTTDASEALAMAKRELPDVLLLDVHMPRISGLDILRVMGLDPVLQHIPVLILTAATDPAIRKNALDLGASDFLTKPIDPNELLPRVRNAITLKTHYDMVANEAARLEQQVERRTRQLESTRQQLILSLARAAEHRDNDTGNHVIRVGRYAAIIAAAMGYPPQKLSMLEQAAQLHDVGKIGIPDSILFKPGKLDPDQYDLMKRHCAIGKQIIKPISEKDWEILKTHTRKGENMLHVRSSPLLMLAARIAQTHHEKWDGSGYPLGLEGEDIPLEGRIVAVADVFDALSSARPYKKAFSRKKCFSILEEGRGKHFDSNVLDAFFRQAQEIVDTQLLLMDDEDKLIGDDIAADED
ncbi:MAG: response regulator [Fuerstiella sp.]|nr:response regulator [Fuerstiella sp.]MCP4854607.1 response regulator [Fuerstiella sp.]